jgi:hypothetical protein
MLTPSDQIRNLVARYVRNVDLRDHDAQIVLFSPDAVVRMLSRTNGREALLHGPLVGGKAVAEASAALRPAILPDRTDRHCTTDHLISIDGDEAALNAQFLVFRTTAREAGVCSTNIVETGHYRFWFRRGVLGWSVSKLDIIVDSPADPSAFAADDDPDVQHVSESLA